MLSVQDLRRPRILTALVLLMLLIIAIPYYHGLTVLVDWWSEHPEYSYGFFIPPLVIYFLWQRRREIAEHSGSGGGWIGVPVALAGTLLFAIGELSALINVVQYAFVIVVQGVAISLLGWKAYRRVWAPLAMLFLAIPLPNFLYFNLSSEFQLWSSQIGVAIVRLFDIPVYLEGNVIDLGSLQLQVVDACSGLRYTFPLLALAVIFVYVLRLPRWQKALLILTSIPITILMNSLRIGIIGISVRYWGKALAEGFLHYFEGWVIFMLCLGILFVLTKTLIRLSGSRDTVVDRLQLSPDTASSQSNTLSPRFEAKASFWFTGVLLVVLSIAFSLLPKRQEILPPPTYLSHFPMQLGTDWQGSQDALDPIYLTALKLTDYLLADYHQGAGSPVNLYVAYYASQRGGASVHSPKSCIPGGGWRIEQFSQVRVPQIWMYSRPLSVNRAIISKGDAKKLVYYWFQERGRLMTNEYLVKFFLLWDSLKLHRTDGALVRLTTNFDPTRPQAADHRLQRFLTDSAPALQSFIPGS